MRKEEDRAGPRPQGSGRRPSGLGEGGRERKFVYVV